MPQLNPAPWLLILLLSWVTLLMLFKTKTLLSTHLYAPTTSNLVAHHAAPWNWPWT